ncbi:MAG: Snf7 family protein [archaeon]|nr:Snf7 family protein [archaeon]
MNFFGKKKKEVQPPPEDLNITSMRLGQSMEDTSLKLQSIEAQLKAQLRVVQECRNPSQKAQAKKKAMMLLKKKKMYESHLNNLSNTQMTVDSANLDCELMRDNLNIMRVMQNTMQVQKDTLHAMGGIDHMYDVLDDM